MLLVRIGLAVALLVLSACGGGAGSDDSTRAASGFSAEGRAAAERFLDRYVAPDGGVVRRDQGNDVVSEGQAYGMLIAELVGDDETVRRIWGWTRAHLNRPDGLLSFHADGNGTVLDRESAADADILAAYALLRYDGAGSATLHRDGKGLAQAVLAHETVPVGDGGLAPVAGSWVRGEPAAVNPSYWMPEVSASLAGLTGDERWQTVADTTARLVAELTDDGARLPPDWAEIQGGRVQASAAPDGSRPPQYGPDAQRVPVFFAVGCDERSTRLAADWWQLLAPQDRPAALALGLDGNVTDGTRAPLALLAESAPAGAAGDQDKAAELVGEATEQAESAPTYYGDAWLALAAGLAERRLASC